MVPATPTGGHLLEQAACFPRRRCSVAGLKPSASLVREAHTVGRRTPSRVQKVLSLTQIPRSNARCATRVFDSALATDVHKASNPKEAELHSNYAEVVALIEKNFVSSQGANGAELVSCADLKANLHKDGVLLTDRELDRLLYKYEGSHPGFICKDDIKSVALEFATEFMWISLALMHSKMEFFDKTFNFGDKDGSHIISSVELQSSLELIGGEVLHHDEMDLAVTQYDGDSKGGINKREFMMMVHNKLIDISAIFKLAVPIAAKIMQGADMGTVCSIENRKHLEYIMEEEKDRLVVLQTGFTWCRPCIGFKRKYEKFANMYKEARFLKLTVNENEHTEDLYQHILKDLDMNLGSPAFIFFRGQRPVYVFSGVNSSKMKASLSHFLDPHERPADFLINSL
ncbi:hypothetical protein CYMTET_13694 [Cymbomonas tetramitiformis]|uniref:EF-hand domain-containing protein n=1 Tax=Cymbomonas tetramitiformis TaxID=36881 RepID=A0AAE0GHK8_9CHLO|nr:hypothetical protein CYMTET_13694 [Cymbomonas tetramitiformis]